MALPVLPSPDNFLGVALVINRSRDGPRFVFHYPPHVLPVQDHPAKQDGDDDLEDDDDIFADRRTSRSAMDVTGASGMPNLADLAQWNQDDHFITEGGSQLVPWEYVAGFPTKDLENILTPARAYHKTLFQISLDPIYCVSYPIHVPENGIWKKRSKKKEKKQREKQKAKESKEPKREDAVDGGEPKSADADANPQDEETTKADEVDDVDVKDMAKSATEEEDKVSSMNMFNLVFILNPRKHEAKELVDTMYTHIIKKVNKAYKYCQQRSDFVWKESKRILTLKDKAREDKRRMSSLWNEILATSSLAASMQDIYEAISQNKIAALQLETPEGTVTPSVQIPVPFHIADLPQLGEEDGQRGLWITTANSFTSEDTVDEPGFLDKNFALLLMYDEKKIVSELQSDQDDFTTSRMIEFVKHSKPNMSFHQVAQQTSNVLTLGEVRKYAQHFIFWRRAIAIPPLHARDIYILSPNCDMAQLPRAAVEWGRAFPFAPTLPQFLSDLSVAPRQYKFFCPAKSYRPDYLRMLAWLVRGGWVTQLCTFAYVVVWPEIIYEVGYALEAEELAKAKRVQLERERQEEEEAEEEHDDEDDDHRRRSSGRRHNNSEEEDNADGDSSAGGGGEAQEDLRSSTATIKSRPRGPSDLSDSAAEQHPPPLATPSPLSPSASQISLLSPTSPSSSSLRSPAASTSNLSMTSSSLAHLAASTATASPSAEHPSGKQPQPTPAQAAAEKARRARIADKAARELAERATAHARKQPPLATAHPAVNAAAHLAGLQPHLILDAKKATGMDSLYLSAIGRRLRNRGELLAAAAATAQAQAAGGEGGGGGGSANGAPAATTAASAQHTAATATSSTTKEWDERVAKAWPVFCKYFNGRSALERVALQEDMKRKEAWNLLMAMSEYLLCVRHW